MSEIDAQLLEKLVELDANELVETLDNAWESLENHLKTLEQAKNEPAQEEEAEFEFIVPEFPDEDESGEFSAGQEEKSSEGEEEPYIIQANTCIINKASKNIFQNIDFSNIDQIHIKVDQLSTLIELADDAQELASLEANVKGDPFRFAVLVELFENNGVPGHEVAIFSAEDLLPLLGVEAHVREAPQQARPEPVSLDDSLDPEAGAWTDDEEDEADEPDATPAAPEPLVPASSENNEEDNRSEEIDQSLDEAETISREAIADESKKSRPAQDSPEKLKISQEELDFLLADPIHHLVTPDLFESDTRDLAELLPPQEAIFSVTGPDEYPPDRVDENELNSIFALWEQHNTGSNTDSEIPSPALVSDSELEELQSNPQQHLLDEKCFEHEGKPLEAFVPASEQIPHVTGPAQYHPHRVEQDELIDILEAWNHLPEHVTSAQPSESSTPAIPEKSVSQDEIDALLSSIPAHPSSSSEEESEGHSDAAIDQAEIDALLASGESATEETAENAAIDQAEIDALLASGESATEETA
ncbi:MAG: hypothetical protein D6820_08300, partial [Lentisphaerae bacterium]